MDEISRSVGKNLKNGNYYKDARDWYAFNYLYPITERTMVVSVAIITFLLLLYSYVNTMRIFPLKSEVPVIVTLEDTIKHFPIIQPMVPPEGTSITDAYAEYLLKEYVKTYESYDIDTIDKQIQRITQASSRRVARKYKQHFDIKNPRSPRVIYQDHTKRIVTSIDFFTLLGESSSSLAAPRQARIQFSTREVGPKKQPVTQKWQADVSFVFSNIEKLVKTKGELEFIILDYQVKELR